jgi:hypothetical protein
VDEKSDARDHQAHDRRKRIDRHGHVGREPAGVDPSVDDVAQYPTAGAELEERAHGEQEARADRRARNGAHRLAARDATEQDMKEHRGERQERDPAQIADHGHRGDRVLRMMRVHVPLPFPISP